MTDKTIGSIDTRNAGRRAKVCLVAETIMGDVRAPVTVRDLSDSGARLVMKSGRIPKVGEIGRLVRKESEVDFTVVWSTNREYGISFEEKVAEKDLLERIPDPVHKPEGPRFRRPGLRERAC